ncbi:sugar ABC transporter permease [Paenibacillus filicis]|uniref:Sugar ABC transporter permease n=1 Tax=Paenibacillus gyeongsangnamensis TaxID=3388067 RepID=A0ABT4Q922_9BACL|nr:sugar ABC transporter permease [Paenibacillus filicis]MCZ8513190.1 sugar ABC transporter permease [Paenibacillus filicis]
MLSHKWTIVFFVFPALLIYMYVLPVPILKSIYYSFFEWNLVGSKLFIGFKNYSDLFGHDDVFLLSLKNTLIFSLGCIVLQLPLAFLLANLLNGRIRAAHFFRNVYFFPVIISGTSVGLLFLFIFHSEMGLLNMIIRLLGNAVFDKDWLSDPVFAIYGPIIALSWQYFGYHMVIYLTGMSTISKDTYESATIDGANSIQTLFHITLPLVKPFIVISLILCLTGSVKAFDTVISLTGGGPAHHSDVLALHMYNTAFVEMRYGYGSAVAVVLFMLNILFTLALSAFARERRA